MAVIERDQTGVNVVKAIPTFIKNNGGRVKKDKLLLLASATVIEIAGIIIIAKATASDSSPAAGIVFLAIGLVFLIIGITKKGESSKTDQA